ncbi:MAG: PAS domain S-box protein [Deltaproteobacteria bacterium]|nr:PAS domain S-box protein [Deltaproteobacteria bacterium]
MGSRGKTLREALFTRFTLIAVVPVFAVFALSFHFTKRQILLDVETKNGMLSKAVAGQVNVFLREPMSLLAHYRKATERDLGGTTPLRMDGVLDEHVSDTDLFEAIYLLDKTGRVISVGLRNPSKEFHEEQRGIDLSGNEFLMEAMRTGKPTWSDSYLSLSGGKPSLTACVPMRSGAIAGNFNIDLLQEFTKGTGKEGVGRGVTIAVIDSSGTVLSHTDRSFTGRSVNFRNIPPVLDGLAGRESTREYVLNGEKHIGSVTPISGPRWIVLVSQPLSLATAAARYLLMILAGGAVLCIGTAVWFAGIQAKKISGPFSALSDQMGKVAGGTYDIPAVKSPYVEVQRLAESFRETASAVRDREIRLSENIERYQLLLDNANDAIFVFHVDDGGMPGRFVEVNDVACRTLGYARQEFFRLEVADITAEKDRPGIPLRLEKAREGGGYLVEVSALARDGREIPFEVHAHMFELDGKLSVLSVARNVTERKEAEKALRESEFRYRQLTESTYAIPWEYDVAADRFTYMGPQAEKILGYPPAAWTDLAFWASVIHPEDRDRSIEICRSRTAAGENHEFQYRMHGASGEIHWIHDVVTVLREGERTKLVGIMTDITALKRAEMEKLELEERLRQSLKVEAIGRLAGGIAHDFNNLLQVITGFASLILQELPRHAALRAKVVQIEEAATRATELVGRLLTYSRKDRAEKRVFNLSRELENAVKLLEFTIFKMIEIRTRIPRDLPWIDGDPVQIGQVVLNLCTNARDAMPEGGTLTIDAEEVSSAPGDALRPDGCLPGRYVRIRVTDTGVGMDDATREKIFDPFFTTKDIGKGTGLGLSIVYGIVRNHGGWVTCESSPAKGSVFGIYLPVAENDADARAREEIEAKAEETRGAASPRTDGRILLADDEPAVRNLAASILTQYGYSVVAVCSGEEALETYELGNGSYDLVILDLGMPGMGGVKCLEAIRKRDPGARVIVVSGFIPDDQAETIRKDGALIVRKPFSVAQFVEKVRNALA